MTGSWATDTIEAQGSLLCDIEAQQWSEELCGLIDLPVSVLPPLIKPTDVSGRVTAKAAADTGFVEGTPVVAGCSDSAIEDYAAGAIEPGQCAVKLATAGNVSHRYGSTSPSSSAPNRRSWSTTTPPPCCCCS